MHVPYTPLFRSLGEFGFPDIGMNGTGGRKIPGALGQECLVSGSLAGAGQTPADQTFLSKGSGDFSPSRPIHPDVREAELAERSEERRVGNVHRTRLGSARRER